MIGVGGRGDLKKKKDKRNRLGSEVRLRLLGSSFTTLPPHAELIVVQTINMGTSGILT